MKPEAAKILIRTTGTLAALFGTVLLGTAAVFASFTGVLEFRTEAIFLLVVNVLFAVVALWLLWIGYLVWFRLSPLAVHQTCGALAAAVIVVSVLLVPTGTMGKHLWYGLGALTWAAFVVATYPIVSRFLVRTLFPEKVEKADIANLKPTP